MHADRFRTTSLNDPRLLRILAACIEAVDPGKLVSRTLEQVALPPHRRVYLLGMGKAAEAMTLAAADRIPDFSSALIITKHASRLGADPGRLSSPGAAQIPLGGKVVIMEAGHPIPDESSVEAGRAALDFVSRIEAGDLLVSLISGGSSALATVPAPGLGLPDLQRLTAALLASGASIDEVNVLRRKMDRIKGGGLAAATRARILSLILSDVPGDHLEAIGSGPTAPDPTTSQDAIEILRGRGIDISPAIDRALAVPAPVNPSSLQGIVENHVIGNIRLALAAAAKQAGIEGLDGELLDGTLEGEARQVGVRSAARLRSLLSIRPRPWCQVGGGETTVTVKGTGKGGRNQELALAAVNDMAGLDRAVLVSLATDGEDGPTDAAGAVVTGETRRRGEKLGMDANDCLDRNDAYPFFEALGDLLRTGPTGTNVNDLVFLFGL